MYLKLKNLEFCEPEAMAKTTYQQIIDLVNLLSKSIPMVKKRYDQAPMHLNQIRECAYTDENSQRSPEKFAMNFISRKMRQWLYENHDHPIFEEKNTSALHILVRLEDSMGIQKLAGKGYNFNKIEKASSMSCINLLTGMIGENCSRIFCIQQKERLAKKSSAKLFLELCRHGSTIDISTVAHILTDKKCVHLEAQACTFFYRQHFGNEIQKLMKKVAKLENTYSIIYAFNQQMIEQTIKKAYLIKNTLY